MDHERTLIQVSPAAGGVWTPNASEMGSFVARSDENGPKMPHRPKMRCSRVTKP